MRLPERLAEADAAGYPTPGGGVAVRLPERQAEATPRATQRLAEASP